MYYGTAYWCIIVVLNCQLCFLFQEKVACLEDNDARLALDPQNKYSIQVDAMYLVDSMTPEFLENTRLFLTFLFS